MSSKWQKYKLVTADLTIRKPAYLREFFRIGFNNLFLGIRIPS